MSNIALSSVVSDTFGISATALIEYILSCETFDYEYAKSLLKKSLRSKEDEIIQSTIGYELRGDQSTKIKVCRKHFDYINECCLTTLAERFLTYKTFLLIKMYDL
jgi:hypothetical protein